MFFIFVCKRSVWKKLQKTEPFRNFRRTQREPRVMSAETFISMSYRASSGKRLTNVSMN